MPELTVSAAYQRGGFTLDVDFVIETWPALLFGPSGAGKSTLLRIIAGLEEPDRGRIVLAGRVLADSAGPRVRGAVQLVSQRAALFPHLSVRENIGFGIRRMAAAEKDARINGLLAALHAEKLIDRRPGDLSGGEKQRVALARALAPDPKLLLLDEAFTGLDGVLKKEILSTLVALLAERRVAALHVTHDVGDAFGLAAEVVMLREGKVVGQGVPREVLAGEREQLLDMLGSS